ncbi:aspartyl/asparaginyl beta-hydroxylase domain-containing protein [Sphingomonas donggukensis]|uniref:Aspartyl/asparaginyl beta-hydroxylase domain-containing protein n=1 Tax=Sphingomonas donggukensis TaxID=2949093 RepID=A0ABY4TW33_9SPHN|nr:aspartyl/asparaginyl beta-hydroxylase domain-containing protein [Sphingomonas donggukensis]URW76592.1 aspartyl/asparaginyl beta-hydroxylase domain-containing protein [Sphingomonas donggukensis]
MRDLGAVDIDRLLEAVENIPERFWAAEDAKKDNDFACFHHTRHILFRFVPSDLEPWDHHDKPMWQVWKRLLLPVMEQAIRPYGFTAPEYAKAMFARLGAGSHINRHRDGLGTNLRTHKIHVPLVTNPLAMLEAGGRIVHLERGRAYEVNNIAPHAAQNDGTEDRIHFIFEVYEGAQDRTPAVAAE